MKNTSYYENRTFLPAGYKITHGNNTYVVDKLISYGGFSIVYEVTLEDTVHTYALKEYYPVQLSSGIRRHKDEQVLIIDDDIRETFKKGLEEFKKEADKLSRLLPKSNTEAANCFLYSVGSTKDTIFEANNTCYALINTSQGESFSDFFQQPENSDLEKLIGCLSKVCIGLSALHEKALHLDISDNNILICGENVKIIDLGSALPLEKTVSKDYFITSYTRDFAANEVLLATKGGEVELTPAADTYSLCAILFKYVIRRPFESAVDMNQPTVWKSELITAFNTNKYFKNNYGKKVLAQLIKILEKGLSSAAKRYQSALELSKEFDLLLNYINNKKKSVAIARISKIAVTIVASLVALYLMIFGLFLPKHEVNVVTEPASIYEKGETISFTLEVKEDMSRYANEKLLPQDISKAIRLKGFTASIDIDLKRQNDVIEYEVTLGNVTSDKDGEKSISIKNLYSTYGIRQNEYINMEFDYFDDNIDVEISRPSFEKISTETYEVYYDITINAPMMYSRDYEKSIDLKNFTTENARFEKQSENVYRLYFNNIVANVGECSFEIPEGLIYDSQGRKNKKVASPSFTAVDEYVYNFPMNVFYTVDKMDINQGGYAIIIYTANTNEYENCLKPEMITLNNFEANVDVYDGKIILTNLKFNEDEINDLNFTVSKDAFRSKENGSFSNEETVYLEKPMNKDATMPSVIMTRTDVLNNIIIFKIFIEDETKLSETWFPNPKDYIEPVGFTYDDYIIERINHHDYFILFTNVELTNNTTEAYLKVKKGLAMDNAGNVTKEFRSNDFAEELR